MATDTDNDGNSIYSTPKGGLYGGPFEAVMVDGKWLMKAGKVLAMDEEAVLAEAQRVANTAWPRLFAKRRDLKVPDGFLPDALHDRRSVLREWQW